MTDWGRTWRKLWLREPSNQRVWPWQTRALRDLLIRVADDDGHVANDVPSLQRLLHAGDDISPHVRELIEDGFLVHREDGIFVRNLPLAQGGEVHTRGRRSREDDSGDDNERPAGQRFSKRSAAAKVAADARWGRQRSEATSHAHGASESHPNASKIACDDASESHAATHADASPNASKSRAVSGSSDPSESLPEEKKEEKREDQNQQKRACDDASESHAATHADASHPILDGGDAKLRLDYVTECPPRLLELCLSAGFVTSIARDYGVEQFAVERAIADYRDHFLKGGGFGEKRRHWLNRVRGRLQELHREGRLAGVGSRGGAGQRPVAHQPKQPNAGHWKAPIEREGDP